MSSWIGSPVRTLDAPSKAGVAFIRRPFYVESQDKAHRFVLEEKPAELASAGVVTARARQHVRAVRRASNPLDRARAYASFLSQVPGATYSDAARQFAVSRARISQLIALLSLPPDVIASIDAACQDPEGRRLFTEKRLRPLATLHDRDLVKQRFETLSEQLRRRCGSAEGDSAMPTAVGVPTGEAQTA